MASFASETAEQQTADPAAAPTANYRLVSSFEEMNPRRRSTMEDVHRVVPALGGDSQMSYFGVYDGHGGALRQLYYYFDSDWQLQGGILLILWSIS